MWSAGVSSAGIDALIQFSHKRLLVDGVPYHIRQGRITLTKSNVHNHFPYTTTIHTIAGHPKQRWAKILATMPQDYQ